MPQQFYIFFLCDPLRLCDKKKLTTAPANATFIRHMGHEMNKCQLHNLLFYALPFSAILTWWILAFNPQNSNFSSPPLQSQKQKMQPPAIKYLSSMQRENLHKALMGDFHLMIKLITDWDHDAQIMEEFGYQKIKRFPKKDFLRCQLLARQILKASKEELQKLHDCYRQTFIFDDHGNLFDLSTPYRRFLPQSFVAASFLLTLCEPEFIVALPQGMRPHTHIYSPEQTSMIALDADRYNAEKLYESHPEIAFVADYSHPSTLQTLQRQGIPLFTLKYINSPEEIQKALIKIGHVINRPIEAELLNYFIEAAMQSIDNRFKILNTHFQSEEFTPKVLFLKHYLTFSTPTSNTLTGKLLKRLGIKKLLGDEFDQNKLAWTVPIQQEQIEQFDPDYIIVSTSKRDTNKNSILKEHLRHMLKNKPNKQIVFVDDMVQESPSQYMILAYFDLFEALNPS